MKKGITVFLCSTYSDLIEERRATLSAIEALKLEHESMEFFGARSEQPLDACLSEVRESNVIVVIVGHKYGSLVPGAKYSFTEAEYKEAHKHKKLCLVYMRDQNAQITFAKVEDDPEKMKALKSFKDILNERHTVSKFLHSDDLSEKVSNDLLENIELIEREEKRRRVAKNSKAAFFTQVTEIAKSAVEEGFREALILSSFQTALKNLRDKKPSLIDKVRDVVADIPFLSDSSQPWVFFSYAHSDRQSVKKVADGLRKHKVRVWIDQQELVAGDSLLNEIKYGLMQANALVFFASEASLQSEWVRHELEYFAANRLQDTKGPFIIPVLLQDVELPSFLRDVLYVDMRNGDWRDASHKIASAVKRVNLDEIKAT